jgi:hypothetical protein
MYTLIQGGSGLDMIIYIYIHIYIYICIYIFICICIKGTSVYLTHTRMDMLPSLISGDIASLHGGMYMPLYMYVIIHI